VEYLINNEIYQSEMTLVHQKTTITEDIFQNNNKEVLVTFLLFITYPCRRDAFSIFEAADIVPDDFFIAKGRPAMALGFFQEFFHGATHGCREEMSTCHGIIKFNGFFFLGNALEKVGRLPISRKFGIVPSILL